jgi:hypothetical protein
MRLPHKMFQSLKDTAVAEVQSAVKAGLWKQKDDPDAQLEILNKMSSNLSQIYNIPVPVVKMNKDMEFDVLYDDVHEFIYVKKPSLVTTLFGYRLHMQHYDMQHYDDAREDGLGWAMSMFYTALPVSFNTAWMNGKLAGMPKHPETGIDTTGVESEVIISLGETDTGPTSDEGENQDN